MEENRYDVAALLSGGLDSILAARLLQEQGKRVRCLHFVTPFFGKPELVSKWRDVYNLDVEVIDVSDAFVGMLRQGPKHGFGKILNPCVDCKILLLSEARKRMEALGARVIVTGEVLGQRPMSQRRDALNVIRKEAGVSGLLLRPLSAKLLEETPAEADGFIDRSALLALSGRGRKGQLALAARFGITDIPTPAGGCLLTEKETGRAFWPVLRCIRQPVTEDFQLARIGRQFWNLTGKPEWLCIGRNQADNQRLEDMARPGDLRFNTANHPGPLALGRVFPGQPWDEGTIRAAASFMASFSPKAVRQAGEEGGEVEVRVTQADGEETIIHCRPLREGTGWGEYPWEQAKETIRNEARARHGLPPKESPSKDEGND